MKIANNNIWLWLKKIKVRELKHNPFMQFSLSAYYRQSPILRVVGATKVNMTESLYFNVWMQILKWNALSFVNKVI